MISLRSIVRRWTRRNGKSICYAVLDVETTGLAPETNHVVEIAIITLDASRRVLSEWSSLVRPPGTDELGARHIHGISRSMVHDAPTFSELADEIVERIRGCVVVGHVIEFDLSHLAAEFKRSGRSLPGLSAVSVCTRALARQQLSVRPRTLELCCAAVGISIIRAHRALGDARATAELFAHLGAHLESQTMNRILVELRGVEDKMRAAAR